MSKTYDEILSEAHERFHKENMIFPEYLEGFNSNEEDDNPYGFPLHINLEQIRISSVDRDLTQVEKVRLGQLRDIMNGSQWHKWSYGNYMKEFIKH